MSPHLLRAALCAGPIALVSLTASAHEIVGNRFFPATLAIDDPGVNDELAFPTVAISKTGDDPSVKQLDISGEFSKRITEDFAVSFAPTWTRLYAPGGPTMNGIWNVRVIIPADRGAPIVLDSPIVIEPKQ